MKRWIALLTALCLLVSITALAEDVDLEDAEPTLTPEELEELQELDEVNEEDENVPTNTVGAVYQEKSLSDFDAASPAVYTCKVLAKSSAYTERTTESSKVFYNQSSVTADVLYVGSAWAIIRDASSGDGVANSAI